MRHLFYRFIVISVIFIGIVSYFWPPMLWAFIVIGPLIFVGIMNRLQKSHTILRNFPILGYFRYLFELISPEIQQYFIEKSTDGKPFSRNHRALVYRRAKNVNATHPFGTQLNINDEHYEGIRHSIYATEPVKEFPRVDIGSKFCKHPYSASVLNISAMSFGSLSKNAILALNKGAKKGNFYHNTGEGGLSHYHLEGGGDITWQIGTGYFGCRTHDGDFDPDEFKKKAATPQVKMIEIKLSQGAKPGHGGVLPGSKNTEEIAKIRGVKPHTTIISPPSHKKFSDAKGLVHFIAELRELSDGKPIGFKLCVGRTEEFIELCKEMKEEGVWPDFITVDGAEGGTGAAPLEFSDSVGIPLEPALIFVHSTLKKFGLREEVRVIASGKVLTAFSILRMKALGADICNSARAFMFSIGCIQALRCNTNDCPTGVATQDGELVKGLVVTDKAERVYNFHHNTIEAVLELLGACGCKHTEEINISMFVKGDEMVALTNRYFPDSVLNRVDE
ncbi:MULTISPECIES: FMN-binding glutamate synthase family protein [unclassified Imperialibacter]|uniref:FMN-binding glutamate synthase family protein n=1 Tax=unclassified Imperialibacter TaxID=2629706 RepID=UPI001258363A|nr:MULTISPECIES: FMN-binding glutamate synthase family protein [unclassified Imperialibacter]CAD5255699.1 Glutamate synthase large subunit-like protein YerD [Imperialibacter sp. 89]CAD5261786.1 Glutamate synthase large subunit-like protein YerD [Imperialibacter sp. 75]VVT32871.1 Glutamate synthase large subunit-like protein YerD [Imperialibacter sp. EC-SDR9]